MRVRDIHTATRGGRGGVEKKIGSSDK
ncbi:Protein CBG27482 [Caenorhabditis briggsae]|uniref:Protein CBG27482 n=1 Tax=Caenorhabditis briggsae TaxID=6238 RepID=B6IEZ7_CAEBR|nr:Protein CBG27482 [Caenorhabditis briggsae]CAR98477.1 Protein CBG27482 [Caenorhabditis briggsae]